MPRKCKVCGSEIYYSSRDICKICYDEQPSQEEQKEFKKQQEIYKNYPNINATKEQMAEWKKLK